MNDDNSTVMWLVLAVVIFLFLRRGGGSSLGALFGGAPAYASGDPWGAGVPGYAVAPAPGAVVRTPPTGALSVTSGRGVVLSAAERDPAFAAALQGQLNKPRVDFNPGGQVLSAANGDPSFRAQLDAYFNPPPAAASSAPQTPVPPAPPAPVPPETGNPLAGFVHTPVVGGGGGGWRGN